MKWQSFIRTGYIIDIIFYELTEIGDIVDNKVVNVKVSTNGGRYIDINNYIEPGKQKGVYTQFAVSYRRNDKTGEYEEKALPEMLYVPTFVDKWNYLWRKSEYYCAVWPVEMGSVGKIDTIQNRVVKIREMGGWIK